mmetsp:Transcript_20753/g.37255  ORF Transcript_20753/g.37255 Transcript_20753/m.37255 type:complete len:133 (-) Transcript_20753:304-702(-)
MILNFASPSHPIAHTQNKSQVSSLSQYCSLTQQSLIGCTVPTTVWHCVHTCSVFFALSTTNGNQQIGQNKTNKPNTKSHVWRVAKVDVRVITFIFPQLGHVGMLVGSRPKGGSVDAFILLMASAGVERREDA